MRHTKTAAVLLAVSVFLAACGGSTGSAASGAGVAASETSLLNTLQLKWLNEEPVISVDVCSNDFGIC